jgi:oxygen-independent coproporphyrinogen-3 oxidase
MNEAKCHSMSSLRFDSDLVRRYDGHGPRYTSYPTAIQFHPAFGDSAYREAALAERTSASGRPLSLYVHIPFCSSPCFYCACNRIITRSADRAHAYLTRLYQEIERKSGLFERSRPVEQLHFGGGTPTFLSVSELAKLFQQLGQHFSLSTGAGREYSIEIDPRTVTPESVGELAALGFNRMSLGIQDFDEAVQRAVNRVQGVAETLRIVEAARHAGIASISFDLIYGLPRQSVAGFDKTLETVLEARPDRLAVYAYAHLPHVFKAQRRLAAEALPTPETRLALLGTTIERLTEAGYVYIGMDHFALPDDELARAKFDRTLHRNFQGYSTRAQCDLVGLGVSAISSLENAYAQNCKRLSDYYAAIDAGRLGIERGILLNRDDRIRRAIIQDLMCQERIDCAAIGRRFGIDFKQYFRKELERLQELQADGLTYVRDGNIGITDSGRLLMRTVAMVFDAYAMPQLGTQTYSRVI